MAPAGPIQSAPRRQPPDGVTGPTALSLGAAPHAIGRRLDESAAAVGSPSIGFGAPSPVAPSLDEHESSRASLVRAGDMRSGQHWAGDHHHNGQHHSASNANEAHHSNRDRHSDDDDHDGHQRDYKQAVEASNYQELQRVGQSRRKQSERASSKQQQVHASIKQANLSSLLVRGNSVGSRSGQSRIHHSSNTVGRSFKSLGGSASSTVREEELLPRNQDKSGAVNDDDHHNYGSKRADRVGREGSHFHSSAATIVGGGGGFKQSPLLKQQRERSESITSDYFSSSHNSPVVVFGAKTKREGSSCVLVGTPEAVGQNNNNDDSASKSRKTIVIYENPAFARDEREEVLVNNGDEKVTATTTATTTTTTRPKMMMMKQTRKATTASNLVVDDNNTYNNKANEPSELSAVLRSAYRTEEENNVVDEDGGDGGERRQRQRRRHKGTSVSANSDYSPPDAVGRPEEQGSLLAAYELSSLESSGGGNSSSAADSRLSSSGSPAPQLKQLIAAGNERRQQLCSSAADNDDDDDEHNCDARAKRPPLGSHCHNNIDTQHHFVRPHRTATDNSPTDVPPAQHNHNHHYKQHQQPATLLPSIHFATQAKPGDQRATGGIVGQPPPTHIAANTYQRRAFGPPLPATPPPEPYFSSGQLQQSLTRSTWRQQQRCRASSTRQEQITMNNNRNAQQQQQHNFGSHYDQPPIHTINQSLVISEPLIGSSSWQNKTLINLREQQAAAAAAAASNGGRYLESSLIHYKAPPLQDPGAAAVLRLPLQAAPGGPGAEPIRAEEHLYCSVGTLRTDHEQQQQLRHYKLEHEPLAHYKSDVGCLNQSFHTLVDKMNERNFYQVQSSPNGDALRFHQQLASGGARCVAAGRQRGSAGSSSDSALGKLGARHCFSRALRSRYRLCLWLALFATGGLACLLLLSLLSGDASNQQLTTTAVDGEGKSLPSSSSEIGSGGLFRDPNTGGPVRLPTDQQTPPGGGGGPPPPPPPPLLIIGPSSLPGPSSTTGAAASGHQHHNHHQALTRPSDTWDFWLKPSAEPQAGQQCRSASTHPKNGHSKSSKFSAFLECGTNGRCDSNTTGCFCNHGISGPSCALDNCPNWCSSGHGECRLLQDGILNNLGAGNSPKLLGPSSAKGQAHLESFAFQTRAASLASNSVCPKRDESALNQTWAWRPSGGGGGGYQSATATTYDNRLEWACVCKAGFAGADCSQLQELRCDDQLDDDNDGLIDCEDDDCCSQPVCRDNLQCYQSPEPTQVLASHNVNLLVAVAAAATGELTASNTNQSSLAQAIRASQRFYTQMRFLIVGNATVQSYAQEKAYDKRRVAVVRGRVIKSLAWPDTDGVGRASRQERRGIVGVRVSVSESVEFGFTLTRNDGHFDMLVNGNEWITLQFHRNAHVPIKRKIFVRAQALNVLEDDVEMWLAATPSASVATAPMGQSLPPPPQQEPPKRLHSSFGVQLSTELYKFVSLFKRDNERRRSQLFECLLNGLASSRQTPTWTTSGGRIEYEPLLIEQQTPPSANGDQTNENEPSSSSVTAAQLSTSTTSQLKTFVLSGQGALRTLFNQRPEEPRFQAIYNSAFFPPAASVHKPVVSIQLVAPTNHHVDPRLKAILVQLHIEGQSFQERLTPLTNLIYQFAWNRRNVFGQKVYGFSELEIRVGYEYDLGPNKSANTIWNECLDSINDSSAAGYQQQEPTGVDGGGGGRPSARPTQAAGAGILANPNLDKQVVWFQRKVYIEAHQLNQHADIGKWSLLSTNRLDRDRELIYFGTGWSLPYRLVYPPVISEPIQLIQTASSAEALSASSGDHLADQREQPASLYLPTGRLVARGPNSSVFVVLRSQPDSLSSSRLVQLDSTSDTDKQQRRLLDVPLSILANKLGLALPATETGASSPQQRLDIDDIQIIYNNQISTLYLSSKSAGKIVQVSYSSLLVLNRTLAGGSATAAAEDEIIIEPLCGFGRQTLSSNSASAAGSPDDALKPSRLVRLSGPHSMTLDEERQILYFIDGTSSLMALELHSYYLALLPIVSPSGAQQQSSSSKARRKRRGGAGPCRRSDLQIQFRDYKPNKMQSLVWSHSDSSLYFIDHNAVLALRQDFTLEVVALGVFVPNSSRTDGLGFGGFNLPTSCFAADRRAELGLVKALTVDEANHDLLILHQWLDGSVTGKPPAPLSGQSSSSFEQPKLGRRFYLAKVKLGMRSAGSPIPARVIDLHSASSAWDPLIARLAEASTKSAGGQSSAPPVINWSELARRVVAGRPPSAQGPPFEGPPLMSAWPKTTTIPFIHLSRGFERIDSVEINSDGSIFVLDSSTDSIRLILPYSPFYFNLAERHDVNINRMFPTDNELANRIPADVVEESRKLSSLTVANPISGELMEFHASSGLQMALTSRSGLKSEFYYRILRDSAYEVLAEDDTNDFDVQRLILDHRIANDELNGEGKDIVKNYVRLHRVIDSHDNQYYFHRTYSGSRYFLLAIQLGQEPLFQMDEDQYGILSKYTDDHGQWVDVRYDPTTHLLRDITARNKLTHQRIMQSTARSDGRIQQTNADLVPSFNDLARSKRMTYDRVFYHYCDLFIVEP